MGVLSHVFLQNLNTFLLDVWIFNYVSIPSSLVNPALVLYWTTSLSSSILVLSSEAADRGILAVITPMACLTLATPGPATLPGKTWLVNLLRPVTSLSASFFSLEEGGARALRSAGEPPTSVCSGLTGGSGSAELSALVGQLYSVRTSLAHSSTRNELGGWRENSCQCPQILKWTNSQN